MTFQRIGTRVSAILLERIFWQLKDCAARERDEAKARELEALVKQLRAAMSEEDSR